MEHFKNINIYDFLLISCDLENKEKFNEKETLSILSNFESIVNSDNALKIYEELLKYLEKKCDEKTFIKFYFQKYINQFTYSNIIKKNFVLFFNKYEKQIINQNYFYNLFDILLSPRVLYPKINIYFNSDSYKNLENKEINNLFDNIFEKYIDKYHDYLITKFDSFDENCKKEVQKYILNILTLKEDCEYYNKIYIKYNKTKFLDEFIEKSNFFINSYTQIYVFKEYFKSNEITNIDKNYILEKIKNKQTISKNNFLYDSFNKLINEDNLLNFNKETFSFFLEHLKDFNNFNINKVYYTAFNLSNNSYDIYKIIHNSFEYLKKDYEKGIIIIDFFKEELKKLIPPEYHKENIIDTIFYCASKKSKNSKQMLDIINQSKDLIMIYEKKMLENKLILNSNEQKINKLIKI